MYKILHAYSELSMQIQYLENGEEDDAYVLMELAIKLKHSEAVYCLNFMKIFSSSSNICDKGL